MSRNRITLAFLSFAATDALFSFLRRWHRSCVNELVCNPSLWKLPLSTTGLKYRIGGLAWCGLVSWRQATSIWICAESGLDRANGKPQSHPEIVKKKKFLRHTNFIKRSQKDRALAFFLAGKLNRNRREGLSFYVGANSLIFSCFVWVQKKKKGECCRTLCFFPSETSMLHRLKNNRRNVQHFFPRGGHLRSACLRVSEPGQAIWIQLFWCSEFVGKQSSISGVKI